VSTFSDLGLHPSLVEAAAALGWVAPLAIQRAAVPVLRRGGNAVVRASSGSGITGAYGLALLDRLAREESAGTGARALILVASEARATEVGSQLAALAGDLVRVGVLAPGWRAGSAADLVVAAPGAAAAAVETSTLKLGGLMALVLDGVPALLAPGSAAPLDVLLVSIPPEAQRILTTPAWTRDVDRFAEAHARRALSIPSRPADPAGSAGQLRRGNLAYLMVPAHAKEETLSRLLGSGEHGIVVARGTARADAVRSLITARGHVSSSSGQPVAVAAYDVIAAQGATLAFDVPPDADALAQLDVGNALVLAAPAELPHLRAIADDAGYALQPAPPPREPRTALTDFRDEIRAALRDEDIDAQLLVLDPLFHEFSPAEVAAALSALVRRKQPERDRPEPPAPAESSRGQPFVRLFVSAGQKDGVRPAEIIGAFASEAGITGDQVGRIEIRETFSVVEVDPQVAERVIRGVNGTTLRGRSLRVDYDRKPGAGPKRRSPRPRPTER
jgi:ATP-dependent RNA helicase DeaD